MKKMLAVLSLLLLANCTQSVKKVELASVVPSGSEDAPIEFTDLNFWTDFWLINKEEYDAITVCYGFYSSIVSTNPFIKPYKIQNVLDHEHKHQEQVRKLSCPVFKVVYATVEGRVQIETEAYKAQQFSKIDVYVMLKNNSLLTKLSPDSLQKLISKYY